MSLPNIPENSTHESLRNAFNRAMDTIESEQEGLQNNINSHVINKNNPHDVKPIQIKKDEIAVFSNKTISELKNSLISWWSLAKGTLSIYRFSGGTQSWLIENWNNNDSVIPAGQTFTVIPLADYGTAGLYAAFIISTVSNDNTEQISMKLQWYNGAFKELTPFINKEQINLDKVDNTADIDKSVAEAIKATKDALNQPIHTTYIKGFSLTGKKITVTTGDGNSVEFTTQDTVYTHPTTSGNKHIPSGGSTGQILRWSADGTAVWDDDNNTTYSPSSTTPKAAGTASAGSESTYARGDHVHPAQTSVTGNAGSATKLATARKINGTAFDGTTDITVTDSSKLPTAGGTMTGDIKRSVGSLTKAPIQCYPGDSSGAGMTIEMGGRTIVGSGESATQLRSALGTSAADEAIEEMYISSDENVRIFTNCQNIANRKEILFDKTGNLTLPSGAKFVGIASKAEQLNTARTIGITGAVTGTGASFNGTANVNITANSVKEAYLNWGGKNFAGSYGCIDAAMIPALGANRFAFMIPSGLTFEYSQNGGSTWTTYNLSDANKINFFNENGTSIYLGGNTASKVDKTNYRVRVTINTSVAKVYTVLNKFCIYCSTNGSTGSWCTIEGRTNANASSNTNTWVTFANKVSLSGWSGYNIINTPDITTFGNRSDQYQNIRFTFGVTSHASTVEYSGLQPMFIMGFGGVGWTSPSNMAKYGRIYTYDYAQNVTFPAKVSATSFDGNATSATKATQDSDGNQINTTYLKKSGGTMTGALVAQANANYTTAQVRNVTMSTSAPSGGSNGQIHFQYT